MVAPAHAGNVRLPLDQVIGWLYGGQEESFLGAEHRAALDAVNLAALAQPPAGVATGGRAGVYPPPPPVLASSPLSLLHIRSHGSNLEKRGRPAPPVGCVATVFEGGRLGRVKMEFGPAPDSIGGRRGVITKFSDASRARMRNLVNSLDRRAIDLSRVFFTTLTYPKEYSSARESKRHLKAFLGRFDRAWGKHPSIWKLEPQRRGAPHYHLMTFAMSSIEERQLLAWVADNWADIVGKAADAEQIPRDTWHRAWHMGLVGNGNQPCVQRMKTWDGVSNYCAKYIGKPIEEGHGQWDIPGRFWGVHNRAVLDECLVNKREEPLDVQVGYKLKRICRRFIEKQGTGRYRIDAANGVTRTRMTAAEVARFRALGLKVSPICYRLRRGPGGCTVYLASETFNRLVAWAVAQVPAAVQVLERLPF